MDIQNIQNIQNKLRKLLALSASPNEAEALSAMKKCQTLMEKYNIRTIDVDEITHEVGVTTSVVKGYTKRHRSWESKLAAAISEVFDAIGVVQRKNEGWNILFIATTSECEIVTDLFKRLRRTISVMGRQYAKEHKGNNASLQKSYAFGMIDTIHTRLMQIQSTDCTEMALVVVKKEAINSKLDDLFPNIPKQQVAPPKNRMAYIQGGSDGENVNLSKSLHNGSKKNQLRHRRAL